MLFKAFLAGNHFKRKYVKYSYLLYSYGIISPFNPYNAYSMFIKKI